MGIRIEIAITLSQDKEEVLRNLEEMERKEKSVCITPA